MKILYGVIPTLIILLIIISNPLESEAQALESRYAFNIYLVFDAVDIADAIQVKDAFKTKSETYPLKDHFIDWHQAIRQSQIDGRDMAIILTSFTFDSKADCIAFYNWIITNMPQDIRDNIIYGRILVTDNTHHYPNDQIKRDVVIFETTIGNKDDAELHP